MFLLQFYFAQIVDEFAGSQSEEEIDDAFANGSDNINHLNVSAHDSVRKCSIEENNLDLGLNGNYNNGNVGRPQRRKRSMEERHPEFVHEIPVKVARVGNNSENSVPQLSKKNNET